MKNWAMAVAPSAADAAGAGAGEECRRQARWRPSGCRARRARWRQALHAAGRPPPPGHPPSRPDITSARPGWLGPGLPGWTLSWSSLPTTSTESPWGCVSRPGRAARCRPPPRPAPRAPAHRGRAAAGLGLAVRRAARSGRPWVHAEVREQQLAAQRVGLAVVQQHLHGAASLPPALAAGPGAEAAGCIAFGRRLREVDVDRVDLLHHASGVTSPLAHQAPSVTSARPMRPLMGELTRCAAQVDAGRLHGGLALAAATSAFDCWKAACALSASCWLTARADELGIAPGQRLGLHQAGFSLGLRRPGQRQAPLSGAASIANRGWPAFTSLPSAKRRLSRMPAAARARTGPRGRPPGAPAASATSQRCPPAQSRRPPRQWRGLGRRWGLPPPPPQALSSRPGRRGTGPGGGQNGKSHSQGRGKAEAMAASRAGGGYGLQDAGRQRHLARPVKQ